MSISLRRTQIAAAMRERGRDPAGLRVTVYSAKPDPARNREYAQAGLDRMVHPLPAGETGNPARSGAGRRERWTQFRLDDRVRRFRPSELFS